MTDSNIDENRFCDQEKEKSADKLKSGKNALEWSVFALGLTLVLATLGFLGREALTPQDSPPRLQPELGEPLRAGDNVLVPVEVRNRGARTAKNVEVEVAHGAQKSNFTLGFVPRRGQRSGWVSFRAPVQKAKLRARVLGYEQG